MRTSAVAESIQDGVQAAEATRGLSTAYRRVRPSGRPTYSIVIASREPRRELEAHLYWLTTSNESAGAEIVVARAGDPTEMRSLRASYPAVRFVSLPKETPVSELRAAGMSEAAGDIVTLLDDSAVMLPGRLPGAAVRLAGCVRPETHAAARIVETRVAAAVVRPIEGDVGI